MCSRSGAGTASLSAATRSEQTGVYATEWYCSLHNLSISFISTVHAL